MPDSVKLAVDIHLPSGYMGEGDAPSKFPIVLLYTPYHRSEIDLVTGEVRMAQLPNFEIFTSRGYAFIAADARVASEQTRPLTNVIRDCVTRLWNQRDTSAIAEYLGETCWRHDAGEPDRQFMQFDQAFQHQRAEEGYATGAFDFQFVQMLEGGDFVTMIWDLSYTPSSDELTNRLREAGSQIDDNGEVIAKGIEVFCIKECKIVEVWVAQGHAFKGHWGPNKT